MLKRQAFSLVELLVVVAIIAILLSLLMPALGQARDTAQFAICKNNLAQINKAFTQACDDGRGDDGVPGSTLGYYWISNTKRYLAVTGSARSKAMDCPLDIDGNAYTQNSGNLSYGYNLWWLGWGTSPNWNLTAYSFGKVNNPSKMIAFADSDDDKDWDSLVGHNATYPANPRHKEQTLATCNFMDGHVEGLTLLQTYNTSTRGEPSMMNLAKP
ncbi:MAG: hypothetical protein RL095_773 [Verrucomicrobiota bacterium]|jgi:prepilin-type N-terminal cleavage/methylation domain-containing protein